MYILGIDGGGTKTTGCIVAPTGAVKALAHAGGTNINSAGFDRVEDEMKKLIASLKNQNLQAFNRVGAVYAGMAGAGNDGNKDKLTSIFRKVIEKGIPYFIDNDAIAALYSGSLGQEGIVHISGTGSIAYGINRDGNRERVGGWGYLLGDPGSGFAVGKEALTRLFDGYDKGRNLTVLDVKILHYFSTKEPAEIIPIIYGDSDSRKLLASIVPLVVSAADEGDSVAQNILGNAARDISTNICCLTPKLFTHNEKRIPVVLTGGLFTRKDWFLPTIKDSLEKTNMNYDLIVPTVPPLMGSVIGAYKMLNKEFDRHFIQRLKNSLVNIDRKMEYQ